MDRPGRGTISRLRHPTGTVLGAFLGSIVLALLLDGFNLIGISANIILLIFGAAVLLAMVVNVQLARVRAAGRS